MTDFRISGYYAHNNQLKWIDILLYDPIKQENSQDFYFVSYNDKFFYYKKIKTDIQQWLQIELVGSELIWHRIIFHENQAFTLSVAKNEIKKFVFEYLLKSVQEITTLLQKQAKEVQRLYPPRVAQIPLLLIHPLYFNPFNIDKMIFPGPPESWPTIGEAHDALQNQYGANFLLDNADIRNVRVGELRQKLINYEYPFSLDDYATLRFLNKIYHAFLNKEYKKAERCFNEASIATLEKTAEFCAKLPANHDLFILTGMTSYEIYLQFLSRMHQDALARIDNLNLFEDNYFIAFTKKETDIAILRSIDPEAFTTSLSTFLEPHARLCGAILSVLPSEKWAEFLNSLTPHQVLKSAGDIPAFFNMLEPHYWPKVFDLPCIMNPLKKIWEDLTKITQSIAPIDNIEQFVLSAPIVAILQEKIRIQGAVCAVIMKLLKVNALSFLRNPAILSTTKAVFEKLNQSEFSMLSQLSAFNFESEVMADFVNMFLEFKLEESQGLVDNLRIISIHTNIDNLLALFQKAAIQEKINLESSPYQLGRLIEDISILHPTYPMIEQLSSIITDKQKLQKAIEFRQVGLKTPDYLLDREICWSQAILYLIKQDADTFFSPNDFIAINMTAFFKFPSDQWENIVALPGLSKGLTSYFHPAVKFITLLSSISNEQDRLVFLKLKPVVGFFEKKILQNFEFVLLSFNQQNNRWDLLGNTPFYRAALTEMVKNNHRSCHKIINLLGSLDTLTVNKETMENVYSALQEGYRLREAERSGYQYNPRSLFRRPERHPLFMALSERINSTEVEGARRPRDRCGIS